jgi:multidrug efflux pump
VVDDAIIVVENASRRIEEGEPPLLAAFLGARQIGFAVIATTLVLSAVILPLAALQGTQGRLLREFAVALIAALVFSCLVALTLSPMLCSKILVDKEKHGRIFTACQGAFEKVAEKYAALLARVLAYRGLVVAGLAGIVVLSVGIFLVRPQELAPPEDRGVFITSLNGPEGATLDYMTRELKTFESILQPYRGADGPVMLMGSNINAGFGPAGVNRGNAVVRLKPWNQRSMSAQELAAEVRPKLMAIPGSRVTISFPNPMAGGGGANQIQLVIGGNTFEELTEWRDAVLERLAQVPGISGWQSNYEENKPQLRVKVDRERAADLGIDAAEIGNTLETMMGGRQVTRYIDRGEEYDVMLQASDADRTNPRDLSNIYIRGSGSHQLVPLENLIKVSETAGATQLSRYNRLRAITLTGVLDEKMPMGEAIKQVSAVVHNTLPPQAHLNFEGAARQQIESTQSIAVAFGMALLAAFLVLSAQFENFRLPGIILLAAPPAIFGGMVAILLTGMSVNIYTEIGLIMLIGMVAKNAILMVEFANQLRDEGRTVDQAIREAAQLRFRPIVMTSIATVFGALPLALATGAGAEARAAIGWVIVGGLTIGTSLALFITPVLYSLFAIGVQPVGAVRQRLKGLQAQRGAKEAPAE